MSTGLDAAASPSTDLPDDERFTAVVERSGPRVLAYLTRRVDVRADAADVLSETLATAWRRVEDLPDDEDQALAWLIGVARHTLANHRRAGRRRDALTDRLRDHLATSTPRQPGTDPRLREVLDALAPEDREVLLLAAWDGLSGVQIAEALRITPSAARQRLARARQRVRAATLR